jgi:hypothetical protein
MNTWRQTRAEVERLRALVEHHKAANRQATARRARKWLALAEAELDRVLTLEAE